MPYLIDGHNLIAQLPDIDMKDPNDEALLVQRLSGFVARTKQKCVVIFDHGLPGGKSRMSTRGVEVVFASTRTDADTVMIQRIQKQNNPKAWVVVSSDNAVLEIARRYKMQSMRSMEFVQLLRRPPAPAKPDVSEAPDVRLSSDEVEEWLQIFKRRR